MRKARMLNYVPLSRLKRFFQKWCSDQGIHSHKWDHLQWREAKDMFKLKEKNKSLPWKKYTGDLETLKRDYVFGILDPSQAWNGGGQPGAGETVEDVMGNDSESDEEDVDVSEAICINGMSLGRPGKARTWTVCSAASTGPSRRKSCTSCSRRWWLAGRPWRTIRRSTETAWLGHW